MKNIVFLQFQVGTQLFDPIYIQLYSDDAPRASDNFLSLCDIKENQLSYKNSTASIMKGYAIQGGRLLNGLVTRGAKTVMFPTEISRLRHSHRGVVTTFNGGPDTNTSEFQIIFTRQGLFDGVYAPFGEVLYLSMPTLDELEALGVDPRNKREPQDVRVVHCGHVTDPEEIERLLQQSNELKQQSHQGDAAPEAPIDSFSP